MTNLYLTYQSARLYHPYPSLISSYYLIYFCYTYRRFKLKKQSYFFLYRIISGDETCCETLMGDKLQLCLSLPNCIRQTR